MSKGLESWKYLCENHYVDIPIPKGNETDEDLDDYAIGCGFTIEKELKRLEWYDNLGKPTSGILPKKQDYRLNQLLNCFEYIDQEKIRSLCQKRYEEIVDIIDENETNKKVLKIIVNKNVDVALLKLSENVERYNTQIKLTHLTIPYFELNQEEYDLVLGVLYGLPTKQV